MENVLEAAVPEESGLKTRRAAMLLGGAALAGLALSRSVQAQSSSSSIPAPQDIFNFALNLEYLEAQFYAYATTGQPLAGTTSGAGTTGTVTIKSNPMVQFTDANTQAFAMELAQDEATHVADLQSAINAISPGYAVAMPNIDLLNSFNTLTKAAGLGNTFDPFASQENFLIGAYIFEDVGVTAYQGAAPYLMNGQNGITTTAYLDAALGIHGVEAYHAGSIRQRISAAGLTNPALLLASINIANLRSTLSAGASADDIGVTVGSVNGVNVSTLVDTVNNNAMTFARTTSQVLNIVYGGGAAGTGGLFFPSGMNGVIK